MPGAREAVTTLAARGDRMAVAAAAAGIRCLAVPTAMTLHQDFTNASSIHGTLHEAMTVIAR